MQISNAASSPTLPAPSDTGPAADDATGGAAAQTPRAGATPDAPSQDAAVTISAAGAAAAARDSSTADASTVPASADTPATSGESANPDGASDGGTSPDADAPSALKSLTYGTLGLERPDQPQSDTNPYYTLGRWIAAGITIGGLITLMA